MKLLAAVVAALVVSCVQVDAAGSIRGGVMSSAGSPSTPPPPPPPPPSGACSGWASSTVADGCAGAPPASAYTIQHPDFFSGYAQQSGQSYVTTGGCKGYANCHPPWAVAGVDYPVGVSTEGCANDSPSTCGPGTCAASGSCGPTSQYGFGNPGSATDPTVASSPNYHGNPANCTKQSVNQITCKGPTSQPVDIGPFDFSWQGNAGGVGLSISIGNAVTGPCVIHDDYFVFDFGQTYVSSIVPYVFYGCSSVTFRNDVFRTRNPTTGVLDARWPAANGGVTVFVTGPSPTPKIHTTMEYTAFITCPARCITVGDFLFQYNYFGGATMYEPPTKSPAHGDGWMASFYDATCDCANQVSFVEKFDTWLQPSSGVGGAAKFFMFELRTYQLPIGQRFRSDDKGQHDAYDAYDQHCDVPASGRYGSRQQRLECLGSSWIPGPGHSR